MQPGSLVVVKPLSLHVGMQVFGSIIEWLPKDDENQEYTVREIFRGETAMGTYKDSVRFEEGVIGTSDDGKELGINIKLVREVQPPMNIEAIIEECIYQPVEL